MNEHHADPPARCDTEQRRAIIREAHTLGIPHDYGTSRALRVVREPRTLVFIGYDIHQRPQWLAPHAARALARMRNAAATAGIELQVASAFRSADYQLGIIRRKLERGQTMREILRVSAAPGYSEHHSGRALDLMAPGCIELEEAFENSPAFAWLCANARVYGFVLSYPRGNPHGITYEPWHWCWHARS